MQYLIPTLALLSAVTAAPFELISKRALTSDEVSSLETRNGGPVCPGYLVKDQFEFPHYITQVSKSYPDKSWGPQYNGVCSPKDTSTIYSFDIPASRKDATCSVVFYFPKQAQLTTSSYSYSGGGTFYFEGYTPGWCPDGSTTYNTLPKPWKKSAPIHMEPGYAYTIDVGPCAAAAGTCMAGKLSSSDTSLTYFQDYNPCPIGLYTTYSYGK